MKSPDDEDFQSWWSRQIQRKKNIQKVCEKYGESLRQDSVWNNGMIGLYNYIIIMQQLLR